MAKRAFTDLEFQNKLLHIKMENKRKEQEKLLSEEKRKYDKPCMETNKIIAIYLFALLNVIVIYSMAIMWVTKDAAALGILISDIAAQVLIYAIYCMKAYHGKKQSEIIKFAREQGGLDDVLKSAKECKATVPLTTGSIDISDFEN